jgi:hypothetical protein
VFVVVVAVLFEPVDVVSVVEVVVLVLVEFVLVEFVDSAGVATVSFEAGEVVEFYEPSGAVRTSYSSLLPPLFVVSEVVVFVELAAFSS